MGLLDSIIGAATGSAQGTAAPGAAGGMDAQQLMAVVAQLLQQSGGLQGLLAKLQAGGLGEAAQSWVGTGANQPVSADQLGGALGPDLMGSLGSLMGGNGQQASSILAQVLPGLVDQMTPQGRVTPDADNDPMAALGGLLGGGSGQGPDLARMLGSLLQPRR